MNQADVWYSIFDGRYRYDPDRALVLTTADTLKEAREGVAMFNEGPIDHAPVIAKMAWRESLGGYVEAGIVEEEQAS